MQVSQITPNQVQDRNNDRRLKVGAVAASVAGVGITLACIAKKQGFSLSPSSLMNTRVKDWALFKLYNKKHPDAKEISLEGKEVLQLAAGSVLGGLAGGALFDDKKHMKSKFKEAVNQYLGNVTVPIACVWGASELYKRNKANILKRVPQISQTGKASKVFNSALKAVPGTIITFVSLGFGIIAGNKVSNFLNEKIFHKKVERGIKTTDFAPHVDDLGIAVSLMADKSPAASFIQRVVPFFLCVPGIEVATHREK